MKFSIITPVYNRADCISRCLDSVVNNLQWGIEIEHIVVDDGSTDDSSSVVQDYKNKYSHILFIKFSKNRGTNAARNAAIAQATGDYCIILDSDDYFLDNAIKTIYDVVKYQKFRHYLFMPDDMVEFHQRCDLLKGKKSLVLTFDDMLLGRVNGDFIHVIQTGIMQQFPFMEELRIQEAVFFQRFYKEAQFIFYSNEIVTLRDRGRSDSVSRTCVRDNKPALQNSIKAAGLWVEWFGADMEKCSEGRIKEKMLLERIYNYSLILSDYSTASRARQTMKEKSLGRPKLYLNIIHYCRLGKLYYQLGHLYVKLINRRMH